MTKTDRFAKALLENGFREYRQDGKRAFERSGNRRHASFTLLGNGWVHVYTREFPAREGWAIYNCRVSEARKLIGWV
jgi:hypothetical protein